MAPKGAAVKMVKPQAGAYKDKTKPADVRTSNINAAKGAFPTLSRLSFLATLSPPPHVLVTLYPSIHSKSSGLVTFNKCDC